MVASVAQYRPATRQEERWLTRNEASDLIGVSVQTLMKHERKGRLHPRLERRVLTNGAERNVYVVAVGELMALPRRGRIALSDDPDELCARAFELFDSGRAQREVVIELRVAFPRVVELFEHWQDAGGSDLILGREAKKKIEALVGSFASVSELAERLAARMSATPEQAPAVSVAP